MRRSRHVSLLVTALAAMAGLTTAGCSSSVKTASGPGTPATPAAAKQPTGEALKIGHVNNEGGGALSVPELRVGAQV